MHLGEQSVFSTLALSDLAFKALALKDLSRNDLTRVNGGQPRRQLSWRTTALAGFRDATKTPVSTRAKPIK
jgi:hypothetical protein